MIRLLGEEAGLVWAMDRLRRSRGIEWALDLNDGYDNHVTARA